MRMSSSDCDGRRAGGLRYRVWKLRLEITGIQKISSDSAVSWPSTTLLPRKKPATNFVFGRRNNICGSSTWRDIRIQHRHPVADSQGLFLVVGYVDESCAGRSLNILQLCLHLAPDLLVKAERGSSSKSSRGRGARARAIAKRCCSPPDSG